MAARLGARGSRLDIRSERRAFARSRSLPHPCGRAWNELREGGRVAVSGAERERAPRLGRKHRPLHLIVEVPCLNVLQKDDMRSRGETTRINRSSMSRTRDLGLASCGWEARARRSNTIAPVQWMIISPCFAPLKCRSPSCSTRRSGPNAPSSRHSMRATSDLA